MIVNGTILLVVAAFFFGVTIGALAVGLAAMAARADDEDRRRGP